MTFVAAMWASSSGLELRVCRSTTRYFPMYGQVFMGRPSGLFDVRVVWARLDCFSVAVDTRAPTAVLERRLMVVGARCWFWLCSLVLRHGVVSGRSKSAKLLHKWRTPERMQGCPSTACLQWMRSWARLAMSLGMCQPSLRSFDERWLRPRWSGS